MPNRPVAPAVRLADASDVPTVAALLCGFRDWWGYDEPSDAEMEARVGRVVEDGDGGVPPRG